jgi:hypothetical protein
VARTVSFTVNDGLNSSNSLSANVAVTSSAPPPPAPTLSNSGAGATYVAGGAAADIAQTLAVADAGSATLASAQVAITGGFLAGDALNFTGQNGVSGSYNAATGVLSLSGTASLANYQAALDSVTFSSSAADPTFSPADGSPDPLRTISFTVNDGSATSQLLAANVAVSLQTGTSPINGKTPQVQAPLVTTSSAPNAVAPSASSIATDIASHLVGRGHILAGGFDSWILGLQTAPAVTGVGASGFIYQNVGAAAVHVSAPTPGPTSAFHTDPSLAHSDFGLGGLAAAGAMSPLSSLVHGAHLADFPITLLGAHDASILHVSLV